MTCWSLNWREREHQNPFVRLHRNLLEMRRSDTAFRAQDATTMEGAVLGSDVFVLRFTTPAPEDERLVFVNLGIDVDAGSFAEPLVAAPDGHAWTLRWSSADPEYGGYGTPPVLTDDGWRLPAHATLVMRPVPASRRS